MAKLKMTKQLPVTVKVDGIKCAQDCPQLHWYAADDPYCGARVCGHYNEDMQYDKNGKDKKGELRCEGCLRDFGNGEQPEEPTETQPRKTSLTDPTECPICGGRAEVSIISMSASRDNRHVQMEYFCMNYNCEGRFGFTKELK